MNAYFLETEMPRRLVELRRDMERSHWLADLLGRRFRSRGAGRGSSTEAVPAVEPVPA